MNVIRKTKRPPLPAREFQVGQRLKEIRGTLRLTQNEVARQLGIKRQRLASYEEGRAPVRYDLALRICRQFIISERWLATGKGDPRLMMDLTADHSLNKIAPDTSFGRAYDESLGARYELIAKEQGDAPRILIYHGEDPSHVKNLFDLMLEKNCSLLKPVEIAEFLLQLNGVGLEMIRLRLETGRLPPVGSLAAFIRSNYLPDATTLPNSTRTATIGLTKSESPIKVGGAMKSLLPPLKLDVLEAGDAKPLLPPLLARLNQVAAAPGKKSELAVFLGVSLASVSRWLSGTREPGGEITLKLFQWADQEKLRK